MHRIVAAATVANEWLVRHRYGLPTAFFGIGLISIVIGITASQYAGAQLLRAEVGKDAARWAAFLGSSLDRLGIIVETGMIAPEESRTLNRIAKAGGLTSYRIIGPDGRVMIASSPETIGQKIFADGFGPSIRGGGALASIERADTADGGTAVIGRATVPIMSGKTFLGAIEVSIDRTARAADHVRMTTGLTLFLGLLIAAIALVATAYVQQRDSRRQAGQSGLEQLRNTLEQQRGEFTLQTEQLAGRHQGAAAPRQTQPAQNQPAPNQPPPIEPSPIEPQARADEAMPPRILLVESDPLSGHSTKAVLDRSGYRVDVALDGLEAVAAVRRERYDAVLMEYRLPVMDGVDASRMIRGMDGAVARTPIIAITAEATGDEAQRLIAAGANGQVSKPIQSDTLGRIIENYRGVSAAPAPAKTDQPGTPTH